METQKDAAGAARWRLLIDEAANAAWNMAADEAMLLSHAMGEIPPTLRFYTWKPAAVSLGYFQKAEADIDREACARLGIDVIRRLTGGRAVLHDAEVTYSLVVREDEHYIPAGVTASYLFFSRGLQSGLARLGINAQMQTPEGSVGNPYGKMVRSSACFDTPSHYEITVAGRKVVGSAQVRRDGVLLQHGSILLRFSPECMSRVMPFKDEKMREAMQRELSRRATDLAEATGRQISFAEAVEALQAGITEQCRIHLDLGEREPAESNLVIQLVERKYSAEAWNLRR